MAGRASRLGEHLASLDAARFCGRAGLLDRIDSLLAGRSPIRIVLVRGPGGIGKSALLREIDRRAAAAGRPTWALDARALDPVPGELERTLDGTAEQAGAVVLVDAFEHNPAQGALLRERVLPGLAADALVVVAGRHAPDPAWFRDGWEHVCAEVALPPLSDDDARALLAARGVTDRAVVEPLVAWARGSPLALTMAVSAGAPNERVDLAGVDLNHMIVRRLAGDELRSVDAEVVEVAAVARAVDARLLAGVLPGRPTRAANEVLRATSVAEMVGARVTLHDLVRAALRDDLRTRDPQRYGELRCRIADHLYARATAGEPRLLADLIDLIDDPGVRWGIGGDAGRTCRVDPWPAGDLAGLVGAFVDHKGDPGWWDDLRLLVTAAPETGLVAHDLAGAALGFCVAVRADRVPAAAEADRVLAPVLADARRHRHGRDTLIFRETFGLPGPAGDASIGVLNLAAVLRSGLTRVDRSYILDPGAGRESGMRFLASVGAVARPDLDAHVDGRHVVCWMIDHGPGGMLGQVRDVIYAEAGVEPPGDGRRRDEELARAAREALRTYSRPHARSGGPFTTAAVDRAVAAAFGRGPDEQLLRRVVELADLDPTVTHAQAMERLAVSRATWFRHLRQARERVVGVLLDQLAEGEGLVG